MIKRFISLALTATLIISFATIIGVSAEEETLADYKMTASEGWTADKLIPYTNGTAGTYYKVVNWFETFRFQKPTSSNIIIVEYDLNNLGNPTNGNYNTLIMKWVSDPSKEVTVMQHRTWDDTGKWMHYKHVIDAKKSTITTYVNHSEEGTVALNVTNLESGFSTDAIYLNSWHGMGVGIDNLIVKEVSDQETAEVNEVLFEDTSGETASDINDLKDDPVAVCVKFSKAIDPDSVSTSITCNGEIVAISKSWNDNLLRVSLAGGAFEESKGYTLSIKNAGGIALQEDFVLSFQRINSSGVIAYYDMEAPQSGITGAYNTREYKMENNGNIYLEVYNDRCTFRFNEPATDGTLTIEFDYKNVSINNNLACSIKLDENGKDGGSEPTLYKIGGTVGGGEWLHFKMIADIKNDVVEVYRDGILVDTVTGQGINNLPEINGVGFERWSTYFAFDNVMVYYAESDIVHYKFRDFGGNLNDNINSLSSALDCIEVEFKNEPAMDSLDVILFNKKTSSNENAVLTVRGRCLEIRPEKGYFDASTDYSMEIKEGYTNRYGYPGNGSLEVDFNTGGKAFGIISTAIRKDGKSVTLADVNAGDTLDIEVKYVLTAKDHSVDSVIALVTEKNGQITSFYDLVTTFSEPGEVMKNYSLEVKEDAEFDVVYAYIWNADTRVPQAECIKIE